MSRMQYYFPINYNRITEILGVEAQNLILILKKLNVKQVFNIREFTNDRGYQPRVGSIFLVDKAIVDFGTSSEDYTLYHGTSAIGYVIDDEFGKITIESGTIKSIEGFPDELLQLASKSYFE